MTRRAHACTLILAGLLVFAGLGMFPPLPVHAATLTVTNCTSSGGGSLAGAIAFASAGDTIAFTPGLNCSSTGAGPITVTATLAISQSLTVDGAGATIVVDGGCTGCDQGGGFGPTGGVRVFDVTGSGTAIFSHLTIQHGHTAGLGGAIQIGGTGTVIVRDSTLTANVASNGGAIATLTGGSSATVSNCTFSGNTTTGVGGGGLIAEGPLTVTGSTFTGNKAPINGGGINIQGLGVVNVRNATFTNNTSGGIGGALSNLGTVFLTNVTMSGNTGSGGGGIATGPATVTLTNTIIAKSTGGDLSPATPATSPNPPNFTGTNNLIDDAATAGDFTDATGGNIVGHPALLGTFGNYGGPTQTIPLLPTSPAIDAGTAVGTGPASDPVPTTDQRGISRPYGNGVDIGAFEAHFTLTISGGSNQTAIIGQSFAQPLTVTLTDNGAPLSGLPVTFTPPATGASATITGSPATTNAGGAAQVTATANATAGTYAVTASAPGAAPVQFSLTNIAPLVSITVTPANGTLKVGQMQQYTATGTYLDYTTADLTSQVTWTSDATAVVTVDATGKATAQTPGTAHITATLGAVSGQTGVTVSAPTPIGIAPGASPASRPGSTTSTTAATPAPSGSGRGGGTGGTGAAPVPTGR